MMRSGRTGKKLLSSTAMMAAICVTWSVSAEAQSVNTAAVPGDQSSTQSIETNAQSKKNQAASSSPATATGAPGQEIVVTAQKQSQRLIDVPLSVSVLSADNLTRSGATQLRDYADTVPGLSFKSAGAGNSQLTLRGVTVGYDVSPTVGVYIDDAPFGSSTVFNLAAQFSLDASLFDVNRIEVLRGPQGTLYGASAMGGIVRYITPVPATDSFRGTIQAGLSETAHGDANYNLAGAVNVPIASDVAAFRATGFESHDGGYVDNVATGRQNVNRSDVYGGRADLLIKPVDRLSIRLSAFLQDITRDGEGTVDYLPSGVPAYGDLKQFRALAEPFKQKFRLYSGTLNYDLGWAALTSISTYQTQHTVSEWDVSLFYAPLLSLFGGPYSAVGVPNDTTTHRFVQEIRLASPASSRPLSWVLGAYYNHEKSEIFERFDLFDLSGAPAPNPFFTYHVPSTFKEYAAFGNLTWHVTDRFELAGGLRYAHNEQEFTQFASGLFAGNVPTIRTKDNVTTYLANARYSFSRDASVYVRYATGYRPGGPNIALAGGGPPTFGPDRLKSYEAGFKGQTADRKLSADLSAYYIDWSDIQIGAIRSGFQTYINALGGATIRGGEATITARPLAGLQLAAAMAYQDAKMSQADPDLLNRKGERLPNVPRFQGTFTGDYTIPGVAHSPSVGFSVRHVGRRNASFDASVSYPQFRLPTYTALDLRAGMSFGPVRAQLYARNIFDKRGLQSVIFPQFGDRVAVIQPRTIGISLKSDF